jgi:nitrate reductase NapAB chaperone NapD
MPVFSYLAYPVPGAKKELLNDLAALDYCEATPADNQEILILVTDTPDEDKEKELQNKLKKLKSLESLGMTFGHTDG